MQKNRLKGIMVLLCLATVLTLFAACVEKETAPADTTALTDTTTAAVETETGPETDENGYLKDDLPESGNLNRDINIYAWSNMKTWEWCDEEEYPTVLLDQALYKRQKNVEERFDVDLVRTYNSGHWNDRKEFIQNLANHVLLNDQMYDLVDQYLPAAGLGATQGIYADLTNVPNLNLTQPWWATRLLETAMIGEQLYFATGDISPTFLINIHCMYANTQLYDDLNLASLVGGRTVFEVVRDYDWTLETLKLLALNQVDVNQGYYGFTGVNDVQSDAFFYGGGFMMTRDDPDQLLVMSPDLTGNALIDWYDDVQKIFTNQFDDVDSSAGDAPFQEGKSLFHAATLNYSRLYTEKGLRFTSLPIPMRDSEQRQYSTVTSFWVSMFSIPTDAKNFSDSGMIMEALASEAYRTVTDVVYYDLFKTRYNTSNGADSAGMFELVSDSVVFDSGRMFADGLKMYKAFREGVMGITKDSDTQSIVGWTTVYAKYEETWKTNIGMLIAAVG